MQFMFTDPTPVPPAFEPPFIRAATEVLERELYGIAHRLRPCERALFLPHLGEFGHRILTAIRLVHFSKAKQKVVCCRSGEEVLYPSADEYVTQWTDPVNDAVRAGSYREKHNWDAIVARYPDYEVIEQGHLSMIQELLPICADQPIPFRPRLRGLRYDVIIGPRYRRFAPERNWRHWLFLANSLANHGYTVGVVGAADTSTCLPDYPLSPDTDAVIEMMRGCRLFVGTDSGNSHLAASLGVPMVTFRCEDGSRNCIPVAKDRHRSILGAERSDETFTYLHCAWNEPVRILDAALARLAQAN